MMADPNSRSGSTYTSETILDFVDGLYHTEDGGMIAAMRRFHRMLAERCSHATVIPTPDGLAVGVVP